jgi:hypothetical protein
LVSFTNTDGIRAVLCSESKEKIVGLPTNWKPYLILILLNRPEISVTGLSKRFTHGKNLLYLDLQRLVLAFRIDQDLLLETKITPFRLGVIDSMQL